MKSHDSAGHESMTTLRASTHRRGRASSDGSPGWWGLRGGAHLKQSLVFLVLLIVVAAPLGAFAQDYTADLKKLGLAPPLRRLNVSRFEFTNLATMKKVNLEKYRGKALFINFWATWCPPCREEMPAIARLDQFMPHDVFAVIAVNEDEYTKDNAKRFRTERKIAFPMFYDEGQKVGTSIGLPAMPTTLIVDRKGDVVGVRIGPADWDTSEYMEFFKKLAHEGRRPTPLNKKRSGAAR